MKKFLLTALAALAISGVSAEESLVYGPCTDEYDNIGYSRSGIWYSVAVKIGGESAKALKGSKLTEVQVGMGSMTNKEVELFVSTNLDEEPIYTQEFRGRVNKYTTVELETPYECTGEEFYIGYKYLCTSGYDWPVSLCDAKNPFPNWAMLKMWYDGDDASKSAYQSLSEDYGNLCIRGKFVGENLPSNLLYPISYVEPPYVIPGEETDMNFLVINMGATEIKTLEITYSDIDLSKKTIDVTLERPIAPGATAEVPVSGFLINQESKAVNLEAYISKVNGETNLLSDIVCETNFQALNNPFPRRLVIEEFTGLDCGYCPRGYVAMEYMRENYPDVIVLAVHNYSYPRDPMNCESYLGWGQKYIQGAPQAIVNRFLSTGATKNESINAYNLLANRPCIAQVEVTADYKDETAYNDAVMTVKTTFNEDLTNHNYGLAFAVTEDNLGPYLQSNYYSGGSLGAMDGFENLQSKTPLVFNDVARTIWSWQGQAGSIPVKVEANKENVCNFNIKLDNVKDHRNAHVIALLIDRGTGEIITGAKNIINNAKNPELAVSEVLANVDVFSGQGTLQVTGEFEHADVYTLGGIRAASLETAGEVELPAGLYIVKVTTAQGTETVKTLVK